MFDFERLIKELNDMAFYILQCFKREYESYLSTVKSIKLEEMLKLNQIVVLDGEIGGNKIHINPLNERFKKMNFKEAKQYYLKNVVLPEIFRIFITVNISKSEYKELMLPNLQQEFSLYLRNGFSSYIIQEFCVKYRLDLPDENDTDNLDFVKYMESILPEGRTLKKIIFYYDYIGCLEQVLNYSGINLLEAYKIHLEERKELENNKKDIISRRK